MVESTYCINLEDTRKKRIIMNLSLMLSLKLPGLNYRSIFSNRLISIIAVLPAPSSAFLRATIVNWHMVSHLLWKIVVQTPDLLA